MRGKDWVLIDTLVRLENEWITIIGEHVENESGQRLNYWRVERCDSVIIIPIHKDEIILPVPQYRHGIGKSTLDFPGGRYDGDIDIKATALKILKQELMVDPCDVVELKPINGDGWIVDSAFSNQSLFSFEAQIAEEKELDPAMIYTRRPADKAGAMKVLQSLLCLQCRGALLEWMTRLL